MITAATTAPLTAATAEANFGRRLRTFVRVISAGVIVTVAAVALASGLLPRRQGSSTHATIASSSSPALVAVAASRPASEARPHSKSLHSRRVVLYGDSLAWQARDFFTTALADAGITNVTTHTFGGTAICDWFEQMRTDAEEGRPDAVVIEFSGNTFTPCMHMPDGRPLTRRGLSDKYAADAATVLDIFAPTHALVFFAGAPVSRDAEATNDDTTRTLHAMYAAVAGSTPYGRYVDAGEPLLKRGHWSETLPCLPGEPCTGGRDAAGNQVNVVRSPDGAHFCPGAADAVEGVTTECPVWASGSWRFGQAMAEPVIAEFGSDRR